VLDIDELLKWKSTTLVLTDFELHGAKSCCWRSTPRIGKKCSGGVTDQPPEEMSWFLTVMQPEYLPHEYLLQLLLPMCCGGNTIVHAQGKV
jgi:hypothetical protein